jgi:UDP-N-acetyl-D-mannosaminuronic acid transferase (WecB/TagA/CpsF family)
MAIDAEFEKASAAHTRRKRGYVRHNPGDVIPFATTLEVQDHVDLKAMAHADGMTIAAFCKKLIAKERRRRQRMIESVGRSVGVPDASVQVGCS